MDISMCPVDIMVVTSAIRVLAIRLCPLAHWSTGRMDIRMSNGHFYLSSGHYGCHFCHQSACHQTMSIGPLIHWTNRHKNVQWTFLCVQWTLWLFNRQNTVTSAFRVLAIRQCPLVHWPNGHKNVRWEFLFIQWTFWLFKCK